MEMITQLRFSTDEVVAVIVTGIIPSLVECGQVSEQPKSQRQLKGQGQGWLMNLGWKCSDQLAPPTATLEVAMTEHTRVKEVSIKKISSHRCQNQNQQQSLSFHHRNNAEQQPFPNQQRHQQLCWHIPTSDGIFLPDAECCAQHQEQQRQKYPSSGNGVSTDATSLDDSAFDGQGSTRKFLEPPHSLLPLSERTCLTAARNLTGSPSASDHTRFSTAALSSRTGHWTSFIRMARDRHEQNVEWLIRADSEKGERDQIIVRTLKQVGDGEELLVWYNEELARSCDVPIITPAHITRDGNYRCLKCLTEFRYPNPLKSHIMLQCASNISNPHTAFCSLSVHPWLASSTECNQRKTNKSNLVDWKCENNCITCLRTGEMCPELIEKLNRSHDDNISQTHLERFENLHRSTGLNRSCKPFNYQLELANKFYDFTVENLRKWYRHSSELKNCEAPHSHQLSSSKQLFNINFLLSHLNTKHAQPNLCSLENQHSPREAVDHVYEGNSKIIECSTSPVDRWNYLGIKEHKDEMSSIDDVHNGSTIKNNLNRHNNLLSEIAHLSGNDNPVNQKGKLAPESVSGAIIRTCPSTATRRSKYACSDKLAELENLRKESFHIKQGSGEQISMEEQIDSHTTRKGVKGHKCRFCGKFYSRRYGLTIHLRTHSGYKPLECKVCGRPFGDPSNLNKHIRLHSTGDSPYACKLCGKILVRRRDLDRHVRSRHPDE